MLKLFGVLLMIAGVLVGLYVGIWWGFIGGIVTLIETVRAPEVLSTDVAYGIARIIFCQCLGLGAGAVLFIPGLIMVASDESIR